MSENRAAMQEKAEGAGHLADLLDLLTETRWIECLPEHINPVTAGTAFLGCRRLLARLRAGSDRAAGEGR